MRPIFGRLHRWAGLLTAGFLFFSGVTGAVISWDHELDDLLNKRFFEVTTSGPAKSSVELAALIEQRDPRARVNYLLTAAEPGESLSFFVQPRIDPSTGKRFTLDYNQVFLDPNTGAELGRRFWGAVWPVTRENFVSFLYKLHYTMQIPEFWGSDRWGARLLGIIAIIWTIDCFVGFYLTLPARRRARAGRAAVVERELGRGFLARWAPAWTIKTTGSAYRINFDIHRAFSLWTWALLFVIAFTAFSLNLYFEVFSPLMKTVSNYTPTPYEQRPYRDLDDPIVPKMSFADILARATADGKARGWETPVGSLFYGSAHGVYAAAFFNPGEDHGAGGVGPAQLYYDSEDGRAIGERLPWVGTAADIFVQAQFPLHSGRIIGLPGRILISVMGLVVAALSVTGVVIWWRKRRARVRSHARAEAATQHLAPAE
ncbi:putative iron-regulated membrane protein [Rhodopseudomonas rhenobacensis]|uniref:Putative iron-regulated membrane protein n=1 Tax=Rhodopseudomonas rhenobacensis TaxID=87461 RepID=A0A7W8DY36_9BRAD|nr:siderophore utilization protein FsrB [Rhodopseudomonas rhenobacensis]MBB5046397.1 putative iron-regulated membrane protein [Rhodopseudomonas rhenobacensis]